MLAVTGLINKNDGTDITNPAKVLRSNIEWFRKVIFDYRLRININSRYILYNLIIK